MCYYQSSSSEFILPQTALYETRYILNHYVFCLFVYLLILLNDGEEVEEEKVTENKSK